MRKAADDADGRGGDGASDARGPYRCMAAVLCVFQLAGAYLFAERFGESGRPWQAWFAGLAAVVAVGFGHLAITGRSPLPYNPTIRRK